MAGFEGDTTTIVLWALAMCGTGIVAGLLAGLLGVGGGAVIVPVLYQAQAVLGVEEGLRMKVAVATSLATIIATSAVSVRSHFRRGAVDVPLLRQWGIPIFLGTALGTMLGGAVDGRVLTAVFATVAFVVAIRMFVRHTGIAVSDGFPNRFALVGSGMFVGGVSALMGIGGGMLSVPILSNYGFDIRRAVGTAAAIGFIIAIPGTLGYIVAGWGVAGLPPYSFGYFNGLAALALVPLTMATAPLGARLAHSVPRRSLQIFFACFLLISSLRMFYDLAVSL